MSFLNHTVADKNIYNRFFPAYSMRKGEVFVFVFIIAVVLLFIGFSFNEPVLSPGVPVEVFSDGFETSVCQGMLENCIDTNIWDLDSSTMDERDALIISNPSPVYGGIYSLRPELNKPTQYLRTQPILNLSEFSSCTLSAYVHASNWFAGDYMGLAVGTPGGSALGLVLTPSTFNGWSQLNFTISNPDQMANESYAQFDLFYNLSASTADRFTYFDDIKLTCFVQPICEDCVNPVNIIPHPQSIDYISDQPVVINSSWKILTNLNSPADNFTADYIRRKILVNSSNLLNLPVENFVSVGQNQIIVGSLSDSDFVSSVASDFGLNLQNELIPFDRHNQGYLLLADGNNVVILSNSTPGAFYGGVSLEWLLKSQGNIVSQVFFDGFESSSCSGGVASCLNASIWQVQGMGSGSISNTQAYDGLYSLYFAPTQAVQSITTQPGMINASGYDTCNLSFYILPEDITGTFKVRFSSSTVVEETLTVLSSSQWGKRSVAVTNPALLTDNLRITFEINYGSSNRDTYIDDISLDCTKLNTASVLLPNVKITDWPDMNIRAFYGQAEQIYINGVQQNGNANKFLVDSLARYKYNLWTVAMGPGAGFLNPAGENSMQNYLRERHFYSSMGLLPQNIRYLDYRLYDGVYVENLSMSFTGRADDWEIAVSEDTFPSFLNVDFENNVDGNPLMPDNWYVSSSNSPTNYWAIDCTQAISGGCSAKLNFSEDYRGTVNRSRRLYSSPSVTLAPNKLYKIKWWAKVNGNSGGLGPMVQMALRDAQGQTSLMGKVMPTGTFGWSNYSFIFSTSGFESAYIWTDLQEPAPLEYWIDNMTFEEISNDLNNIIETNATRLHVWNEGRTVEYVEGIDFYLNKSGVLNRQFPFVIPSNQLKTYLIRNESGNIPFDGNVSVDYDMLVSFYNKPDYTPRSLTLSDPLFYEIYKQRFIDPGLDQVQPDFVWLAMDEIASYSGDSRAKKRNLTNAEIFGLAIRNISDMIHEASPNTTIIIWGDMLHPNHNGHPYYQVATGGVYGSTTEGMHYFDKNRTVVLQWWYDPLDVGEVLRTSNTLYSSYGLKYFGGSWKDRANNKEWSEVLYKDDAFGMLNHEFGAYLIPEGGNYSWNSVKPSHPVILTPGAMEYCDGLDNDGDNLEDYGYLNRTWSTTIDEGFNLTMDHLNCGSCGNACIFDMGFGSCNNGVCQLNSCFSGFNDTNGDIQDGCEVQLSAPVEPECSINSDCDDSSLCTTDSCVGGACVNVALDCSSLNGVCVQGTCNPANGQCRAIPANTGGSCNDGDSCTTDDFCWNGACVGFTPDCNDNITCTMDSFSCETSECLNLPDDSWCVSSTVCSASVTPPADGCISSCGNGSVDIGEDCEGLDLNGANCISAGYPAGELADEDLACDISCRLNSSGCSLLPVYSLFNGSTTNFGTEANISIVNNAVLEVTEVGKINFTGQTISFERLDLNKYVFIEDKKIGIDTSGPRMGIFSTHPSILTFYNIDFVSPKVLVNGVDCVASVCNITSYNSTSNMLEVKVSGFSNYTVVAGQYCGDESCNNGEDSTSCLEDCPVQNNNPPRSNGPGPSSKKQCDDGKDNDGDGLKDYPLDLGCSSRTDNNESNSVATTPTGCYPQLVCGAYTGCVNGTRTRSCYDIHYCGLPVNASMTSEACDFVPDEDTGSIDTEGIFGTTRYDLIIAGIVILLGLSGLIVSIILLIISEAEYRKRKDH